MGGENGEISLSPWSAVGNDSYSLFGSSVASAGDVDNNGYEDIIIGAPGLSGIGYAYVYLNSSSGLAGTPTWSKSNLQAGAKFGSSVAGMGDVNHDGYDDILVGAPSAKNDNEEVVGCVYLYHGSASGLGSDYDWKYCGDQVGGLFGATLTFMENMDNDFSQTSDFLVGMPNYSASSEQKSRCNFSLFFGSTTKDTGVSDYFEMTTRKAIRD